MGEDTVRMTVEEAHGRTKHFIPKCSIQQYTVLRTKCGYLLCRLEPYTSSIVLTEGDRISEISLRFSNMSRLVMLRKTKEVWLLWDSVAAPCNADVERMISDAYREEFKLFVSEELLGRVTSPHVKNVDAEEAIRTFREDDKLPPLVGIDDFLCLCGQEWHMDPELLEMFRRQWVPAS
jgi:hypothetical protein